MHWVRMMFVRIIKSHFREASLVLLGSAVLVSPPVLGASVRIVPDAAFQVRDAPEGEIDLPYLRALANQGDALMQFALGLMYETGEIGPKNDVEAAALYRLAADQGLQEAQVRLAVFYAEGRGVTQDTDEAIRLYYEAALQGNSESQSGIRSFADQGFASAQYLVGLMFDTGVGLGQRPFMAVQYYNLAARQGHAEAYDGLRELGNRYTEAQFHLGSLNELGEAIEQDYAEALRWYHLAAAQGEDRSQYRLGMMYAEGLGVEPDFSEAAKWFRVSVEEDLRKYDRVGELDPNSEYRTKDYMEGAREKLRQLAEREHPVAQFHLGLLQEPYARKWYKEASALGLAEGQYGLAEIFLEGRGAPQNAAAAVRLYGRAAEGGLADAKYKLGMMYVLGRGVLPNTTEALKWYQQAAEQGVIEAQMAVGSMYATGQFLTTTITVPTDYVSAYFWLSLAGAKVPVDPAQRWQATNLREVIKKKMTLSEIRQAERREHGWYQQAAAPAGPGARSLLGRDRLASAQYNLGLIYAEGRHVAPNIKEAVVWFRQAAENDLREAQYDLAEILVEGDLGVVRNLDEAVRWYRRLASQDFRWPDVHPLVTKAQFVLGEFYEQGLGVPQDDQQAADWFERAGARGHGQAQLRLATMYLAERGVDRILAQALMWIDLAATRLVHDTEGLGRVKRMRDVLLVEMTELEVLEAYCLWQLEHPRLEGLSTAEMYGLALDCQEIENRWRVSRRN